MLHLEPAVDLHEVVRAAGVDEELEGSGADIASAERTIHRGPAHALDQAVR